MKRRNPIVFHLPYSFGELQSGSRVRPYKMCQAMMELGFEVDVIAGTVQARKTAFEQIRRSDKKYLFCYSEPGTYPIHPLDYRIFCFLKRRSVPIGIYYRDAYWRFPEMFAPKGAKAFRLLLRYKLDLTIYRHVARAMFFPSQSLANLFDIGVAKIVLPPGGENRQRNHEISDGVRAVYVGGISGRYGIDLLLRSFQLVNRRRLVVLDLVCREQEFHAEFSGQRDTRAFPWLQIHHLSGDSLADIYSRAHFGIIPLTQNRYNNLALPVKLFEYLSFGLPVIVTNCEEVKQFVSEHDCGLVSEDDPRCLAGSIEELISNPDLHRRLSRNAMRTILNGNLWEDRARTVADVLRGPPTVA